MGYFKMTKRIVSILIIVLIAFSFQAVICIASPVISSVEKNEVNIWIDDAQLVFSEYDGMGVPFIDLNGRTQVPVKKTLEAIGATVSFQIDAGSGEKNIFITKDERVIKLVPDNNIMRVNEDTIYLLDTFPQILNGRTFMPIRAVLEILGYSVSWDSVNKIISIRENIKALGAPVSTPIGQYQIPNYQPSNDEAPEVIVNQGYIYYLGENHDILQTSFCDLTKSKTIYACPGWVIHLFNDEEGVPRLYYHTEGASMGTPHQFILNVDGSLTELNQIGYPAEIYQTGGKTFAFTELKFGTDHLEMKTEDGDFTTMGGSEILYQYKSEMNGFNGKSGIYLRDNNLYLIGAPADGSEETAVYQINITSNEVTRITNRAYSLQIEEDYLYYNTGKEIWKRNLIDGSETSLFSFNNSATNFASVFSVLNGNLYIADRNSFFIEAGNDTFSEEGDFIITCSDMAIRGDGGEQYLICDIGKNPMKEDGIGNAGLWVYDEDGTLIMEREGEIWLNSVSIEDGKICYYNKTTNQVNVELLNVSH